MPKKPVAALAASDDPKAALRSPKKVTFACVSFKQGAHKLFCFVASAKQLWELVQINKREEDKDKGYQRALSPARAEKIARFIERGNMLPGSVLLSFDEDTKIGADGLTITIPNRADAGWVIDGQHRLAGASKSKVDIDMPVVGLVGLSLEEQINCFVTINREQMGVSSSLYYELLKHLPITKTDTEMSKERAADLATKLKNDEASPFFGRIVVTVSPKRGELSLTNFVRKIGPLLRRDNGRLTNFTDEDRQGIINNYYKALQQVFPSEYNKSDSVFFKTLGFGALMNVFPTFIDLCLQNYHGFRVADAASLFRKVDYFNFADWHEMGTGNAAEILAGDDLRTELQSSFEDKQQTSIKLE